MMNRLDTTRLLGVNVAWKLSITAICLKKNTSFPLKKITLRLSLPSQVSSGIFRTPFCHRKFAKLIQGKVPTRPSLSSIVYKQYVRVFIIIIIIIFFVTFVFLELSREIVSYILICNLRQILTNDWFPYRYYVQD